MLVAGAAAGRRVVTQPRDLIEMPGWRPILRQVATRVLLVSLLPMAVFYVTLSLADVRAAALITTALYCAGLVTRALSRQPVPAAAVLGVGLLGMRTVILFCTGSTFVYFLQPVAVTVAVATTFAATALAGRPVIERLALDFCPLPPQLVTHLRSAKFFNRVSLMWTISYGINAAGTAWFLTTVSLGNFIIVKSVLGPMLTSVASVASYLVFRRTMRQRNVRVRFANHQGWTAAST
jgi:uncharacterized membrane protein